MQAASEGQPVIEWRHAVPVLGNPVLLQQAVLIFGLSPLLPLVLIALAWLPEESFGSFLDLALLLYALALGLLAAALIVSALLYRRGMGMSFRVDERGFSAAQDDRRSRIVSHLAVALGTATGNPAAAGAGALSRASTDVSGRWSALSHARYHGRLGAIELRNRWRTVAVLYCDAAHYPVVAAFVRERLAAQARPDRRKGMPPPLRGLAWTLFVIACVTPLYLLQAELHAGLMPLMITTAFAGATVWFLPGLALGLAGGMLCTVATMGIAIAARGYLGVDGMEMAVLGLAGLAGLAGLGIAAWRGRFVPILLADLDELSGGG